MYGKTKWGIESIENHAEAVARWEDTKKIRGRATDDRPIGKRRNTHALIRKNNDGSVACVLYQTDVVTFFPDNKVRVNVPSVWRTNSTATFIEEVLGMHRVRTGVKDRDVVLAVRGNDARYLRAGENTIFEVAQGGSLTLLSNDRVHTVLNIDRTAMNAVRKSIAPFIKVMKGMLSLREGQVSLESAQETVSYLIERGIYPAGTAHSVQWYQRPTWDLKIPANDWASRTADSKQLLNTYKFVIEQAKHGDSMMWNHITCWLAMSAGRLMTRNNAYVASTPDVVKLLDSVLMATHPEVFMEKAEERDCIQVNRYRYFAPFIKLAKEQA